MFSRKKQKQAFEKKMASVRDLLKHFASTRDPEAIHQFRVEVKKLNALLYLSSFTSAEEPPRLRALQLLFNQAGAIRTAGMHLHLMERFGITDPVLTEKLQFLLQAHTQKLDRMVEKLDPLLTQEAKALAPSFSDLHADTIRQVYRKLLAKLVRTLSESGHSEDWHSARKKIKRLLYIHALLKETSDEEQLNTGQLKKLEESIGNWHDQVLLLGLLHHPCPALVSALEKTEQEIRSAILVLLIQEYEYLPAPPAASEEG